VKLGIDFTNSKKYVILSFAEDIFKYFLDIGVDSSLIQEMKKITYECVEHEKKFTCFLEKMNNLVNSRDVDLVHKLIIMYYTLMLTPILSLEEQISEVKVDKESLMKTVNNILGLLSHIIQKLTIEAQSTLHSFILLLLINKTLYDMVISSLNCLSDNVAIYLDDYNIYPTLIKLLESSQEIFHFCVNKVLREVLKKERKRGNIIGENLFA